MLGIILNFCEGHKVVVLGDFNLPSSSSLRVEGNLMVVSEGCVDQLFLNCFNKAEITQWVSESTFVASGNILDLFLTSETDQVGDVEVLVRGDYCHMSSA